MKSRREPQALLPLLELLAEHTEDTARSENIREFAQFAIEQISSGNEFIRFVLGRTEHIDGLSRTALQTVIGCGGPSAVVLVLEQMALTSKVAVRKTLSNLLARLGEEAVPPLLNMLGDKRWFIVRNITAILGSIASPEAVTKLATCLSHSDIRVCKEAARSLAKIGGREAEAALIRVLQQDNPSLYPQVIASLGGMKSRKALADLIKIVGARDIFLKSLTLKTDALSAIAMIGDCQVTSALAMQLSTHYLLASARGKQLKIAIADCLGRLGDPQVLPVLRKMSSAQDELGNACREAIELIEKSGSAKIGGS
jgi:HEAT repeat protein